MQKNTRATVEASRQAKTVGGVLSGRLQSHQWSILGSTMGNDAEFEAVVAELVAGRLHPPVDSVHALADGRAAFERLATGAQFGKVVLKISDG